jgi:hypothetical protein
VLCCGAACRGGWGGWRWLCVVLFWGGGGRLVCWLSLAWVAGLTSLCGCTAGADTPAAADPSPPPPTPPPTPQATSSPCRWTGRT